MKCSDHIDVQERLGYSQWMYAAEEATKKKRQTQTRCSECNRYYFPFEFRKVVKMSALEKQVHGSGVILKKIMAVTPQQLQKSLSSINYTYIFEISTKSIAGHSTETLHLVVDATEYQYADVGHVVEWGLKPYLNVSKPKPKLDVDISSPTLTGASGGI